MTEVLTIKPVDAYTDADYQAVEDARIRAQLAARVSNADILARVDALDAKVDAIVAHIGQVVSIAESVKDQVGPTLEALASNPMFKMMFGRKSRGAE